MDGLSHIDDSNDSSTQDYDWQHISLPEDNGERENRMIKSWESQELLIRNRNFIKDIEKLKKKYAKSGIKVDSVGESDERNTLDNLRKEFYRDAREITGRIMLPGNWLYGVWDVILGLTPVVDIYCYQAKKSIVLRKHSGHIEIKIFGNVTVNDLRDAASKIRKHIETLDNLGTEDNTKRKKRKLDKTLLIYQMKEIDNKTDTEIADHFNQTEGLDAIAPNEVSDFLKLIKEQIEDSYA